MKGQALTTALLFVPALLTAQQASASASATAQVAASAPASYASYSAESRAKIDAAFQAARAKSLPDEPMRQRIAEGQAKGAGEAQVVAAVQRTQARLEASQSAMIRAGRANPRPEEIASGEQAMARGATDVQIEALVKRAPADRSLAVAFDVLAKLEANGHPVDHALAQVGAKLAANAGDESILSLVGGVNASGAANAGKAGVAGAVTGAVGGVVRRP